MVNKPKWSINDIAYLRESAVLGFLEGYYITGIEWDPQYNRWLYKSAIKHKGSQSNTVVDMHDLKRTETLILPENEIVDQKEALNLAIVNTKQRLAELERKLEIVESRP